VSPEDCGDELKEGDDVEGSCLRAWGLAVEEQIEELQTYGMALDV
jgi:hypothetical protein